MNTRRLIPILISASLTAGTAWPAIVKGRILDGDGQPLPGTSVQLVALPDTVRAGYMISGDDGGFEFKKLKKGNYMLLAEMTGMDDIGKNIELKDSTETLDLGDIMLTENAHMLSEAVVTAIKAAVVAKQDTIEFNAGSFHTAPNATVNDLLKKLPGVEVGSDGAITANGKSIKKILVDGKEFFGDDPTMATKNLPSMMVDRVQVVDRKSDLARITGVDDGEEETVINLTVKKEMNNGWFGNVGGGYGTDGRYQANLMANKFFNGNQITIIAGGNNINDNGFSDRGRGMFRDFGGGGGINTSQRFGLNFNVGRQDESFRVGGNVFYTHSDRKSTRRTATQYLFPDSVSTQSASSWSRDKGHNINSDFRIQWKPNENNTFEFRPNFSINFRDALSNDSSLLRAGDPAMTRVNHNLNYRTNKGHSINAGGNLIYSHQFASKPGRSFSVQLNYSFSDTKEKSVTWSDIVYYLRQEDNDLLYRYIDNHTWNNNVSTRLTWTEPIGDAKNGNFIDIAYRLNYRWNNADKLTYDLPEPENPETFIPTHIGQTPADAILADNLSNSFRNSFFTQELQVGYKKVNKTYNLDAGLLFSPAMSKSTDLINDARNIPERWVWNVSPFLRFRYKFTQHSSIRADYRARTSQPSMNQLQPVADVSDPLNITQGNPDLKPTFTQSINVHFNRFNPETQQAIFTMVNTSFATNSIVSKTITDSQTGGRTTTYGNVNGNFNIFGMAMVNQPFRNRKWRFNVHANARYSQTPGYINGEFNKTTNLGISPSAGITFSSDIFQMSVNPNYSYGRVGNSLPQQPNRVTHSYGFRSDLSLYLPCGLQFNTDLNFSNSTGYSAGYDSKSWLWNAELSYSVLSDKSLTFSVRAYDLLGQTKNISRSVSANTIVDSEFNALTRYVMFGITYNFNTLKKKNKGPNGEDMMWGPPPGGGRGGRMGPPPGGRRPF